MVLISFKFLEKRLFCKLSVLHPKIKINFMLEIYVYPVYKIILWKDLWVGW